MTEIYALQNELRELTYRVEQLERELKATYAELYRIREDMRTHRREDHS